MGRCIDCVHLKRKTFIRLEEIALLEARSFKTIIKNFKISGMVTLAWCEFFRLQRDYYVINFNNRISPENLKLGVSDTVANLKSDGCKLKNLV